MAFDNRNTGILFVNDRKESDKHPDRTGTINIEGVEYFADGWLKEGKGGKQFLSLRFKRKDKQPGQQPTQAQRPPPRKAAPPPPPADPDLDQASEDDIPF